MLNPRLLYVKQVTSKTIIGACGLTIILAILRFFNWWHLSWWFITSPLWFLCSFALIISFLSLLGMGLVTILVWLLRHNPENNNDDF